MDSTRTSALATRLMEPVTRRRGLALLIGLGLAASLVGDAADARKKKRKKKKKPPVSSPVPAPVPVAQVDASCLAAPDAAFNEAWIAQTFRAGRSGQLTSASVWVETSPAGADFGMEIWEVDINDKPSKVLAGTAITDASATPPTGGQVTGAFAAPANVVTGLRYALVFTKAAGQAGLYEVTAGACAVGTLLVRVNEQAVPYPGFTLRFQTVVTA